MLIFQTGRDSTYKAEVAGSIPVPPIIDFVFRQNQSVDRSLKQEKSLVR
jgi:hypothetical protein